MTIEKAIRQYLAQTNHSGICPKAVLFDMDGVLYDSMPFHLRAWQEIADKYNFIACPEDFYLFEGRTGDSIIDELCQRSFGRNATEQEKRDIYEEKASLFNHYNDGSVVKGILNVLKAVKASHLQSLIVTGSGQYSLFDNLSHDFPGYFDREKMVTAYDVTNGKPDPEPYLKGLEKANVKANEAIVIENAPLGVQAGVAAGIFTIAVNTGPLSDSLLLDAGANLLYPDMESLANQWKSIIGNKGLCRSFPMEE